MTSTSKLARRSWIIVSVSVCLILIGHELELHLPAIEHWVQNLGPLAPLGFIGLFVVSTPFFVSVDVLCFAAGLLFPLGFGVAYIIRRPFFVLGRYLFRPKVVELIAKHPKFAALDAVLDRDSFKLMLLLRLTPLPFAMLSYVIAVTRVGF